MPGVLSQRPIRPKGDEGRRALPGDRLVPAPRLEWIHGITIDARAEEVWPWLVQMGCRRGGWYSYDGLDNGGVRSADRIVDELQRVDVGDILPWTPTADDGFVVREVDPNRALVLGDPAGSATWALVLESADRRTTRLVTRARGTNERFTVGLFLKLFWHPIHFAMQRRQLLNIKRRVESRAGR